MLDYPVVLSLILGPCNPTPPVWILPFVFCSVSRHESICISILALEIGLTAVLCIRFPFATNCWLLSFWPFRTLRVLPGWVGWVLLLFVVSCGWWQGVLCPRLELMLSLDIQWARSALNARQGSLQLRKSGTSRHRCRSNDHTAVHHPSLAQVFQ